MDLLCCHSRRQRIVRRDVAVVECNRRCLGPDKVPEWEVEPGMDVIVTIVKAELPANLTVLGYMQSYVSVRCGPVPGLMWTVHRSPTTWSSAAAPEWQHACPAQPRAALLGAGSGVEMCIEIMQDAVLGLGEASSLADTGILSASQLLLPGEVAASFANPATPDSGCWNFPCGGPMRTWARSQCVFRCSQRHRDFIRDCHFNDRDMVSVRIRTSGRLGSLSAV